MAHVSSDFSDVSGALPQDPRLDIFLCDCEMFSEQPHLSVQHDILAMTTLLLRRGTTTLPVLQTTLFHKHLGAEAATSHADLTNIGIDDHHTRDHVVDGSNHTAGGLTTGDFYRATGATTFAFQTYHRTATASLDFGSIAANTTSELTITVTGAVVGDDVAVTPNGAPESGLVWSGYVSSAGVVTVRLGNVTTGAIDPAARTWRATAWQF